MSLSIAELRAKIAAEIAEPPQPPLPAWSLWTTAAELRFIEGLKRKRNRKALEGLLATVDLRHWTGSGMAVDVGVVRRALVVALGGGEA